jgi:hypothetical protein
MKCAEDETRCKRCGESSKYEYNLNLNADRHCTRCAIHARLEECDSCGHEFESKLLNTHGCCPGCAAELKMDNAESNASEEESDDDDDDNADCDVFERCAGCEERVPSKSIKNHGDGDLCKCCRDFAESEKKANGETKARADAFALTQAQHKTHREKNAEAIQALAAASTSATHGDEDDSDEDCPITLLEQKRMNDEKKRKRQLLHQRIIEANTRPNSPAVAETTTTPARVHFSPSTAKASSDSSVGTAATVEMETPEIQSSAAAAAAAATTAASGVVASEKMFRTHTPPPGAPGRATKKRKASAAACGTAPAAAATLDSSKKQKHHPATTAFAAESSSSSSSSAAAAAPTAVLHTPSPATRRKARASSPKNTHS